jgi:hypothetical protein
MDRSQWFQGLLKTSADGFVWAVEQVPVQRRYAIPPSALGTWSVARHVLHLLYYEQAIAFPCMQHWLGGPLPTRESLEAYDEDVAWINPPSLESMMAAFRQVRMEQLALFPKFHETMWDEQRETVWGWVNLCWIVTKTYQHTAEHLHAILSCALFWDIEERVQASKE